MDRAFELTQGQPWLVNALARQLVDVLVKDRAQPITAADVDRAKEILIERQDTHLDSLVERLREPRIRAVIEPMLAGSTLGDVPEDDRRFAVALGLVRRAAEGGLVIANPIYREIIVRELASGVRDSLPRIPATWLTPDGRLDADRVLDAFLSFRLLTGNASSITRIEPGSEEAISGGRPPGGSSACRAAERSRCSYGTSAVRGVCCSRRP